MDVFKWETFWVVAGPDQYEAVIGANLSANVTLFDIHFHFYNTQESIY